MAKKLEIPPELNLVMDPTQSGLVTSPSMMSPPGSKTPHLKPDPVKCYITDENGRSVESDEAAQGGARSIPLKKPDAHQNTPANSPVKTLTLPKTQVLSLPKKPEAQDEQN